MLLCCFILYDNDNDLIWIKTANINCQMFYKMCSRQCIREGTSGKGHKNKRKQKKIKGKNTHLLDPDASGVAIFLCFYYDDFLQRKKGIKMKIRIIAIIFLFRSRAIKMERCHKLNNFFSASIGRPEL